jgi:hypothetical protein
MDAAMVAAARREVYVNGMAPNVNEPRFVSFPRDLLTGVLAADATPEAVAAAAESAGVDPADVQFLSGEEGLRILNPEGDRGPLSQRVRRKAEHAVHEGDILDGVAASLRSGRTVVGMFHVAASDEQRVREACEAAGVEDMHYIGRWKIE